jgi:hypothetical protein
MVVSNRAVPRFRVSELRAQERWFLETAPHLEVWRQHAMSALASFKAGQGTLQRKNDVPAQQKQKNNIHAKRRMRRRQARDRSNEREQAKHSASATQPTAVNAVAVSENSANSDVSRPVDKTPLVPPASSGKEKRALILQGELEEKKGDVEKKKKKKKKKSPSKTGLPPRDADPSNYPPIMAYKLEHYSEEQLAEALGALASRPPGREEEQARGLRRSSRVQEAELRQIPKSADHAAIRAAASKW